MGLILSTLDAGCAGLRRFSSRMHITSVAFNAAQPLHTPQQAMDLFGQAKHRTAPKHPISGSLNAHPATYFWSKQTFSGLSPLFSLLTLTHVGQ